MLNKRKVFYAVVWLVLIFSLFLNYYLTFSKDVNKEDSKITGFSFLDPGVSNMNIEEYIKSRENFVSSYKPLKEEIQNIISESTGRYGVYFEDLESHAWIGVNEKEQFKPASMLKITTVAAILKQVQEGETSLDTKVTLTQDDLNYRFGNLYEQEGKTLTIKDLIELSMINSDNTAVKKLHQYMYDERWQEARLIMGLPVASVQESEQGTGLTPKEFSNVFRSLYYSGYLSRTFSNWILMLLSETEFNQGIPAGVPKDVVVSHKIGVWASDGSVNDCGIVYAKKPYILCIMSSGTNEEEGNKVIKEISKKVYDYVVVK